MAAERQRAGRRVRVGQGGADGTPPLDRRAGSAPSPMFPSRNHQGISRFRLHGLMKGYCAAAGIPAEKAHMHALKHSCGTHGLVLQSVLFL